MLKEDLVYSLAEKVLSLQFGEVTMPTWIHFDFQVASNPTRYETNFYVDVAITPPSGWYLDGDLIRPMKERKSSSHFVLEFSISERDLLELGTSFFLSFTKVLESNAFRFYEYDPRRGWHKTSDKQLPKSHLLDPLESFSRDGFPLVLDTGEKLEPRCSFCRQYFRDEEAKPPVWAGANLMWVHAPCWVKPK